MEKKVHTISGAVSKTVKKAMTLLLAGLLCMTLFASCSEKEKIPSENNKDNITAEEKEDNDTKKQADVKDKGKGEAKTEADIKEDAESPDLTELRRSISDSGAVLGVAYLGYNGGTFSDVKEYLIEMALHEEYPFVENMELDSYYVTGGDEHYLVVPADKDASVKVYRGVMSDETYDVVKGELILETDGTPFIVRGNESDIIPNIIIVCDDTEYMPCLSGNDGSLVHGDSVYDFTPYEEIYAYFDIEIPDVYDGADPIFCGSWICEAENENDEIMSLLLNLYVDNTAEYSYGYGNSEPVEYFFGDWVYDSERDMILLDMYGGPLDADFNYVDPYVFECGFDWYMDYPDYGTYLILDHREGDPLLFGKEGATFEFLNILEDDYEDYTYLIGSWGIFSEKSEIYLELFPDGSAHYYVTRDGVTEKELRGSWHAEALTLYLNFGWDDSTEAFALSGAYGIMYDGELLTLSILDDFAEPLTAFMAENGYDSFICHAVG